MNSKTTQSNGCNQIKGRKVYTRGSLVAPARINNQVYGQTKQKNNYSIAYENRNVLLRAAKTSRGAARNFVEDVDLNTKSGLSMKNISSGFALSLNYTNFLKMNLDALRYFLPFLILVVGSYLAYDTWVTNRKVEAKSAEVQSVSVKKEVAASKDNEDSKESVSSVLMSGVPVKIKIADAGVDANVIEVGVTAEGAIDAPVDNNSVGWYNQSKKMTESGNIFLDGHYGTDSEKGVFYNLKNLNNGAEITISDGKSQKSTYSVIDVETMDVKKVNMYEVLYPENQGENVLTLMTCAGNYNSDEDTYSERTVVVAVKK